MTGRIGLPDATALDELRERVRGGDRRPIGIRRIRVGPDVLDCVADDVAEIRRPGDVLVVMDHTLMHRRGDDLKAGVVAALSERFATRTAVLGVTGEDLHADEAASAELDTHIAGVGCIVAVGSGTITDLAKDASMRAGDIPFVVVQTAASVNAFTDDMAVLLRDGVKRTVPSRWPDVVIADLDVLASTPHVMHLAGFGELCSMFTAPADWYLAHATGMDDAFDPTVVGALPRRRRRRPRLGVAHAHDRPRPRDARRAGRSDGPDRHRDGRGRADRAAVGHGAPREPPPRHARSRRRTRDRAARGAGRCRQRAGRDDLA